MHLLVICAFSVIHIDNVAIYSINRYLHSYFPRIIPDAQSTLSCASAISYRLVFSSLKLDKNKCVVNIFNTKSHY